MAFHFTICGPFLCSRIAIADMHAVSRCRHNPASPQVAISHCCNGIWEQRKGPNCEMSLSQSATPGIVEGTQGSPSRICAKGLRWFSKERYTRNVGIWIHQLPTSSPVKMLRNPIAKRRWIWHIGLRSILTLDYRWYKMINVVLCLFCADEADVSRCRQYAFHRAYPTW